MARPKKEAPVVKKPTRKRKVQVSSTDILKKMAEALNTLPREKSLIKEDE